MKTLVNGTQIQRKFVNQHIQEFQCSPNSSMLVLVQRTCLRFSRAEYLSVVWHSSLTLQQCQKIENIQKTSLKIILGENYIDYPAALEMTAFEELSVRRQKRCLSFAKKSLNYPIGASMFPQNHHHDQNLRTREKYTVNFAHTESYKHSAVPYCQNLLNADARESAARDRARPSLDWFLLTEHTSRGVGPLGKCETNLGGFVGSVAP